MRRAERGDCAGSLRAWIAAAALLISAGPLAAQTPPQVQSAAQEAIRRLDLQTEFPRRAEPPSWHFDLPPEILWIVLAIALGIILYAFRDLIPILRSGSGRVSAPDEIMPGQTTPGDQAVVMEAADELAARGRFVEAMHLLLLHGLAHIRQRLDQQFSDSLTSREILRSTTLSEAARASLRDVVNRVELTYFGQRPAGLADYTACRESFNALGRALYGSAPA